MTILKPLTLGVALAAASLLPAPQAHALGPVELTEDFAGGDFGWHGLPGRVYYRLKIYADGGTLHLCGGYALRNAHTAGNMTRRAFSDGAITMDGEPIFKNLTRLTELQDWREMEGEMVECHDMGVAPSDDADFDIFFPNRRYRN